MSEELYMRKDYEEYLPFNLSVYEYLVEKSKEYTQNTAVSFYGIKYTYKQLFEKIDEAERVLRAHGIGAGDIVAVSLPGVPEGIFLLYAINKIGAIYCAFDCRCKKPEVVDMLNTFKPKLCIIPTFQMKAFADVKEPQVLYIDPTNAIGSFTQIITFFSNIFTGRIAVYSKNKNLVKYSKFWKSEKDGSNLSPQKNKDDIFGYFYTSGTTYGRKSIILTNENINAAVYQYAFNVGELKREDSILQVMPMFTCYGVTIGVHLPLIKGVYVNLVPIINPKKLKKIILKQKPNFLLTVPAHWEYFVKEKFENCDLSFLRIVCVGGDKVEPEYKNKINEIFRECGSNGTFRSGYGLSETTSVGTFPEADTPNLSVGKPMKNTLLGIFDIETGKPLESGKQGEICIYGPTVCRGYFNEPELTDNLLKKHKDGRVWLHTGDEGYLDEEGNLYFCQRIKRMYVRHDGTKISPYSIEEQIKKCPAVERCMVVAIQDTEHAYGKCGKALIVLSARNDKNTAVAEVNKYIKANLGDHMQPKVVQFVDKLPYTKNGKLDYFAAENDTN